MRNLIVLEYVSIDGVIQAPGHRGEDPSDGFELGGWTGPFMAEHRRYVAETFRAADAFVLGRLTYEIFAAYWPTVTDPSDEIAARLNSSEKFVVSTELTGPAWARTTVIRSDVVAALEDLKARPGRDIVVVGSGQIVAAAYEADLVDEFRLMVHPVVLGKGKKLFPDGAAPKTLALVDARATTTGLVILTYRPQGGL